MVRATVVSFGFKYGIPVDADMVVDMRFLPNPSLGPELRAKNGPRRGGPRVRDGTAGRGRVPRAELEALLDTVTPVFSLSESTT